MSSHPETYRHTAPSSDVGESNALLTAVAAGDRAAFAVLFEHFAPRIATYLGRSGTPPAIAEELAQEAMILVWRKAHRFDPLRGAASTWIFTIARNLRTDRWRQGTEEALRTDIDIDEAVDEGVSPEAQLSGYELESRVRTALDGLSKHHAALVRLSYFAERPHADIARDLSVPVSTVKSRMRVALSQLRRLLDTDRS